MSKYKVVIDTNIFIDGLFRNDSNAKKILKMVRDRKIYIAFSQDTIGELMYITKNFARKYISAENARLALLSNISKLFYYASCPNTKGMSDIPEITDKTDLMFAHCSIKYNADFLISHDFQSGMFDLSKESFTVLSSKDFVELMDEETV